MMMSTQGSPNLADWLQGWGTVTGSIFAALAAIAAVAVLMHDRKIRRLDEAEAATAQARAVLVLAKAEWEKIDISEVTFVVRNFSDNVVVDLTFGYRHINNDGSIEGGVVRTDYVAPRDSAEIWTLGLDPPLSIRGDDLPPGVMPPDVISTRLAFTDAAGRRWQRDGRAQPVRLGHDVDPNIADWAMRGPEESAQRHPDHPARPGRARPVAERQGRGAGRAAPGPSGPA